MFGKIIGAVVGSKVASSHRGGVDSTGGALLGMGAAAVARRLGPLGLIAAAAGGYAWKKRRDRRGKAAGLRA